MSTKPTEETKAPAAVHHEEKPAPARAAAPVHEAPAHEVAHEAPKPVAEVESKLVAPPAAAQHSQLGPYTTLSPMLRNGQELPPGSEPVFRAGEADHVRELLEDGVLFDGTGPEAKAAVEAAEAERERQRNTPPA